MMNIRDFIYINKAKNINKIRILDILGFESNTFITQTPESMKISSNNKTNNKDDLDEIFIFDDKNVFEKSPLENNILEENELEKHDLIDKTSTRTFEPILITSKIKKIWTDIESRRQWVVPAILIVSTLILITSVTSVFISNKDTTKEIEILYETLTYDSNTLINELPDIIEISTDKFYSKYDVSNASAKLQLIESTVMEYDRNLINREGFNNNNDLDINLNNVFLLINELDDLISYRILRSEVLVYDGLLNINDEVDIDILANELSDIAAKSKLNYDNLPSITEFDKHLLLLEETLNSAEDLHGRLIAALRNNEIQLANSLTLAIKMNKDIEVNSFDKSLLIFKNNKTELYNIIYELP